MSPSAHDPCLLITTSAAGEAFGITGLQIDNTLNLGTREFIAKEETEL